MQLFCMTFKLKTYPQIFDYLSIVSVVKENITYSITKYPFPFIRLHTASKYAINLMAKGLQYNDECVQGKLFLSDLLQTKT